MKKFIILFLLFTNTAFSGDKDLFLRYSVNANDRASSLKSLSLGVQEDHGVLSSKWELGVIATGEAMWFGQIGVGVEPKAGAFYIHFFQSIGAVSREDNYLSGYFQFIEDLGLGIKDERSGTAIGFSFKHISNAGMSNPNRGRDMLGLQVRIPF